VKVLQRQRKKGRGNIIREQQTGCEGVNFESKTIEEEEEEKRRK
jgi:hypothetical protein